MKVFACTAAVLLATAVAQQVGTLTAETHPSLTSQTCTSSGCTTESTKVVVDANWRWLHKVGTSTNCYTGNLWDSSICPDAATCTTNCALEGADYSGTYGVTTSGSAMTLKFVTKGTYSTNIGSRLYLLQDDTNYKMYKLLNREFAFDVDMSQLPCGINGALYFTTMDQDGGMAKYSTNKAGAKYGTGYCDAQCARDLKFINGQANNVGWVASSNDANAGTGNHGSCCPEMDIWEANTYAAAFTDHPCSVTSQTMCSGDAECGTGSANRYSGLCDMDGCDFNSFRLGDQTFLGPDSTYKIDTTKVITVVTQFITADGTDTGTLSEIRRIYKQNGVVVANSNINVAGVDATNKLTDSVCSQAKVAFGDTDDHKTKGGFTQMSAAMKNGMVLVMSLWDDHAANCLWLDSAYPTTKSTTIPGVLRGLCPTTSGVPAEVEATYPDASVTYSNIKFGPLGTTTSGVPATAVTPAPTTTTATPTTTVTATTTPTTTKTATTTPTTTKTATTVPATTAPTSTAAHYAQCGGSGWTGPTVCASPYTCTYSNAWYSQCL